ncbi:MAG TPA: tryptophan-rich sensory protein, partial [Cyclobacteriaceae bacterium]|nr:tryptophan-rich sensory protein [Cyclobacteriaceae bacterium]
MKYRIVNLFAFLVMITMNALANILPINGKKTGELSDQYSNLFVPAGITFSIWGVIYILLLSVIVLQFLLRWRDEVEGLRWSIVANFLLNALWIVVWHYEYVFLSLLVMVALLATLLIINRDSMRRGSWIVRLAFGVYMGW